MMRRIACSNELFYFLASKDDFIAIGKMALNVVQAPTSICTKAGLLIVCRPIQFLLKLSERCLSLLCFAKLICRLGVFFRKINLFSSVKKMAE